MDLSKNFRKKLGILLAVLSLAVSCMITVDGVTPQAIRTCGVLAATLFLQIFESFNLCVSCLLSSALLFGFGCVESISDAFSGYTNHVLYFTLASFGLSQAFQESKLSTRLIRLVVRSEKTPVRVVMLTFQFCAALLSSIMSNVAAVVIFIPYVEKYLSYYSDEKKRQRTARTMMIGLAVAAMTGGMITPAGSSMNLIALDMLKKYTGESIRFIDWVKIGLPLALAVVLVGFFVICFVFPPEELDRSEMKQYISDLHREDPLTAKDIYVGVLMISILSLWIASSWIPVINITFVSLVGFAFLFLPDFPVLTWKSFEKTNSWAAFFVAGNHISLASCIVSTGMCDYFAGLLFSGNAATGMLPLLIKITAVTFVFMAIIPSAPAVVTILVPIIISFAQRAGLDSVVLTMACVLCVPNIYLFPLDAPMVVAYDKHAFTMFELPRATIWIQLAMIGMIPLWVLLCSQWFL